MRAFLSAWEMDLSIVLAQTWRRQGPQATVLRFSRGKVRDVTNDGFCRMRAASWIFGGLLCFGVVIGFAGVLHPAADSLSLLRMPLGALCLCAALLRGPAILRALLLCCGVAAAATTLPPLLGSQTGGTLVLYSKNLWYRNADLPALAADIRASGADVVTLQEVSQHNRLLLELLGADFPHQHLCRFSAWSGVAVLSRYPIKAGQCSNLRAAAAALIDKDGVDVWAVGMHLPWPHPYGHEAAARSAVDLLKTLDGPIVIGGDFNIFPWASSLGRIRQASGTRMAGPMRPTFYLRGVPLLLDHAYAPGGGEVELRPKLGSDHLGVLATLRLVK